MTCKRGSFCGGLQLYEHLKEPEKSEFTVERDWCRVHLNALWVFRKFTKVIHYFAELYSDFRVDFISRLLLFYKFHFRPSCL